MLKETPVFGKLKESEQLDYPLDAIVVLGSFIKIDEQGNWYYPDITDANPPDQVNGANLRVDSINTAFETQLAPFFLITGGYEQDLRGQKVSRASKMAEIALSRFDIPPQMFEIIGKRGSTGGNVLDTVEFLENHPEVLKHRKIGILTNAFHLPRTMRFFRRHPFFDDIDLEILPSETLLIRANPTNRDRVINLYKSDYMDRQRKMEKQGIKDLESGTYRFRKD